MTPTRHTCLQELLNLGFALRFISVVTALCAVCCFPCFGSPPGSAPQRAAIDQQLASLKLQGESIQRQSEAVHRQPDKPQAFITPIALIAPVPVVPVDSCPTIPSADADRLIGAAAQTESLAPELLRAVIRHESGFNPCAISDKGAQGLMQLMPSTAAEFHVTDPFDPRQNIRGGAALLRLLLNRFGGDIGLALGAYNAGAEAVDRFGGIPAFPETQNYVSSIMAELGLNPGEPRTYSDLTDEAMTGTQPSENDALQRAESVQAIISDRSENVSDNAIRNVVLQLKLGASEAKPSAISLAAGK